MEAMLKLSSKLKEESPEETVGSKEDPAAASEDNQLQSTREEMGEVKEENERLKIVLARMVKDYQALQMRLFHVIHHDQDKKEENDLVSLSLGSSSRAKREEGQILRELKESGPMREDLSLSLKSRFNSSDNAMEGGVAPLTKSTKMPRSEEDDLAQRNPAKNARVSIRARCDTPTMNDGCQWRKYGQKVAKGNPCPRGYYRCTVSSSCPVRKQVQRCAEDMSILITTYEGIHNHPLPAAATAMASTTAAAASMLMAGASVSSSSLSDNRQIYLQNPSISSYSSYPTITLDLTSPLSSSSSPPSSSYFNYNQQLGFFNHGRQAQEAQMQQLFLQRRASLGPSAPAQNPLSSSITAATKAITADPSFQSALAVAISSIVGEQGSRGSRDPLDQVKPSRFHVGGGAASFFTAPTLNSIQQQAKVVATKSGPPSSVDRGDELKR